MRNVHSQNVQFRWTMICLVVVGIGLADGRAACAQADAASDDDGRDWYAMPEYMPPEVAEFDKIDPDGMADVTFREGVSLNPGKTEHLELTKGYFVAFSLEMDGFKPKRAWVFLARVDEVIGKNKAKVRLSKETAAMLNDDHHVTFFKPKNATRKQLQAFPTRPVEIDLKQSFAPREEPAPESGLPDGTYLLLTKGDGGSPKVEVVKPIGGAVPPPASATAVEAAPSDATTLTPKGSDVPFPNLPEGAGPIDDDAPRKFRTTKSGLRYRILRKGDGRKVTRKDSIEAHEYRWLNDGTVLWDSYKMGNPTKVALANNFLPGYLEGMLLVPVGGMIELEVPGHLAYGETKPGDSIPPNATMHCVIEMLKAQQILRKFPP